MSNNDGRAVRKVFLVDGMRLKKIRELDHVFGELGCQSIRGVAGRVTDGVTALVNEMWRFVTTADPDLLLMIVPLADIVLALPRLMAERGALCNEVDRLNGMHDDRMGVARERSGTGVMESPLARPDGDILRAFVQLLRVAASPLDAAESRLAEVQAHCKRRKGRLARCRLGFGSMEP
jgi:hypothetical protein